MISKHRKILIWSVIPMLLVISLGAWWLHNARASKISADSKADPKTTLRNIVALGYIEPISHVIKVGVPSSSEQTAISRLDELKVSEGDKVESGDILAILDSVPRLKAAIAEAKSTLELRRSQLARAEVNAQATISQQKEILARREAVLQAAQRELNRYEALFPLGAVSKQALDDKLLAVQVAQRDFGEARVTLDKAQAVNRHGIMTHLRG